MFDLYEKGPENVAYDDVWSFCPWNSFALFRFECKVRTVRMKYLLGTTEWKLNLFHEFGFDRNIHLSREHAVVSEFYNDYHY